MGAIHTIFIPKGWSIEQVWEAIKRNDPIPTNKTTEGAWINVDENGKRIS